MFDVIKIDGSHWKFDYIEFYDDFLSCVVWDQEFSNGCCFEIDISDVVCIVNMDNSQYEELYDSQSFEISDVLHNSNICRGVLWKIRNIKA